MFKRMVFDFPSDLWEQYKAQYPFTLGERVLFLGEIAEMPGHCVVVKRDGRVMWGYHTDNFRELTEDEK